MTRALLVAVDLLVLAAAALVLAVVLGGGVAFEAGPLSFRSHGAGRPLVALALLLVARAAIVRRAGPAGFLGAALRAALRTRRRRRAVAAAILVTALAGGGLAAIDWRRDRRAAREAAEARAALYDARGAATIARTTRPLPAAAPGDPVAGGRRWTAVLGPVVVASARVEIYYGLLEDAGRWARGRPVVFRATAGTVASKAPRVVFESRLDPAEAAGAPGWRSAIADLSPFVNETVQLSLEARAEGEAGGAAKVLRYAFVAAPAAVGPPPEGRSVVLVSIDTLRADRLGCYGYRDRPTSPEIDRLAASGTRFAQAIAPSPWTTPSHMSLFTAQYPTVHAVDAPIESSQRRLAGAKVTLAEALRARGYRTAAFTGAGAISAVYGFFQGFDVYDETPRGATGREGEDLPLIYERALSWLEANRERPFFLFLHTYEVHNPYTRETFLGEGPLGEPERRSRLYDGGVAFADAYVGRLGRDIERLGLAGRTVVVVLSDHGEDLAGRYPGDRWYYHGHNLYEELLRVPLVLAGAGVAAGRVVEEQVSLVDVMPTLLALTGTPPPAGQPVQGLDLTPHLDPARAPAPGQGPGHAHVFAEAVNRGPERKAVRTPGRKLVWIPSFDQEGRSPIATPLPEVELLDLVADPGETANQADREPDAVRRLRDVLEVWLARSSVLRRQVGEEAATVDGATFESLRGLGYVQGPGEER